MSKLCDGPGAERQDLDTEALARLYLDTHRHHPNVSLSEFMLLIELLIEAAAALPEETARGQA